MNINDIDLRNGFKMIEASAGTGKTFTLSHLALKKIIEDKINPQDILIITYTKKAANDLREKIIERFILFKKYIFNKDIKNIDETLKDWYENMDTNIKSLENIIPKIESVLDNPRSINIFTIDSLFKKIIDENNIDFNISPRIRIENNFDNIYKSIIDQLWIKDFLSLDIRLINSIIKRNLDLGKSYGKKINRQFLTELLKNIDNDNLYKFDFIYHDKSSEEISKILIEYIYLSWNEFYKSWTSDGLELYEYLISIGKKLDLDSPSKKIYTTKNRKFKKNSELIENINIEFNNDKNQSDLIHQITKEDDISKYFYQGYLKKKVNNYKNFYDDKKFINLQESIYKIKYGFFNLFLRIFISKALNDLEIRKNNLGIFKSNDITKILYEKINSNKFNNYKFKKISSLYKVIFIDEFQDTDNSQWEIIKSLFLTENHLLITVGDPKQAIYKFRGGDIDTYLNAKKQSDNIYNLDTNYRSNKTLLSLINNFYKNGLKKSNLEYKELLPKKTKDNKESFSIINFYKNENLEGLVMNYILNLITEKNIEFKNIGILTKTNKQCEKLMNVAKNYNLPYKITSKKNIFDTEAAELLAILIKFITNPHSNKNFLLFASSKFISLNAKDIDDLEKKNIIEDIFKKCKKLLEDFKREGFISFVNNLILTFKSYELISEEYLLSEIFQLSEIIEEELINNKYNLNILNDWFSSELDPINRKNIGERYIVKNDSNINGININTIHSSKGLEYDIVICPYLWNNIKVSKGPLWKNFYKKNLILEIDNFNKNVESIYEKNLLEEIKENERLIYVALTRAKNKLVIFNNLDNKDNNFSKTILSELENKEKYTIESKQIEYKNKEFFKNKIPNYSIELNEFNLYQEDKNLRKGKNINLISSYSSWIKNSQNKFEIENNDKDYQDNFSKIKQTMNLNKKSFSEINIPNPLSTFPKGINPGICLHKIIEKFNFQSDSDKTLEEIINKELSYFNIDQSFTNIVLEGIKRIINIPLGIDLNNIKLKDIPENNIIKELKYNLALSNGDKIITAKDIGECFLLDKNYEFGKDYVQRINKLDIYSKGFHTGCIDCIIPVGESIEESKWWILDWKSNFISQNEIAESYPCNYDKKALKEEMYKHHYPLQAHLYLLALHRFLKWRLPNYSPEKSLGGFIYIFIRGLPKNEEKGFSHNKMPGLFSSKVSIKRILYLDKLFKYD